jgi:hypothetical protein
MDSTTRNGLLIGALVALLVVAFIYGLGYFLTYSGYVNDNYSNSTMEVNVSKINYLLEDNQYQIETTDGMIFKTNKSNIKPGYYIITINKHNFMFGDSWSNKTLVSDMQPTYHYNWTMHYYNQSDDWYQNWTIPNDTSHFEYLLVAGGM